MTTPNPQRNDIVIVEDDEDLLKMLIFSFKAEGFNVKGFITGKEAADYLLDEKNLPSLSLIILDRLLPDMDGVEILRQFTEKFPQSVPVMILSALSGERDVLTGIREGAVEYITKPFSLQILLQKALALITRFNPK